MINSIGDIAQQILAQDELKSKGAPQPPSIQPDPSVYSPNVMEQEPDISNVVVPNDFVNSICEGKTPALPEETVKEEVPSPQPISEVAELKSLVQEVKDLLIDFKQALVEMTTGGGTSVGTLGTGGGLEKKKKKPLTDDPRLLSGDRLERLLQRTAQIKKGRRGTA